MNTDELIAMLVADLKPVRIKAGSESVMISMIMPVFNEEIILEATLRAVTRLSDEIRSEIIVVDGGSTDATLKIAERYARVLQAPKGKANQLNAGARAAHGEILFFVHADMFLPDGTLRAIDRHVNRLGYDGGGFLNEFSSHNARIKRLGRILHLEFFNRENTANTFFFGDNGIFISKKAFEALGGFKPLPVMEDYDLSVRMREKFRVVRIVEPKLLLSPRRHLKAGFWKTHLQWLFIQRLFAWGVPAETLARWYPDVR